MNDVTREDDELDVPLSPILALLFIALSTIAVFV